MDEEKGRIRIDKWLWAARFFKTRSQAAQAVNGGKVHVNGARIKSAKLIAAGDSLQITRDELQYDLIVAAVTPYRRPAAEARLLYEESQESVDSRRDAIAQRRMMHAGQLAPASRPSKRDRRKIREFIRKK